MILNWLERKCPDRSERLIITAGASSSSIITAEKLQKKKKLLLSQKICITNTNLVFIASCTFGASKADLPFFFLKSPHHAADLYCWHRNERQRPQQPGIKLPLPSFILLTN